MFIKRFFTKEGVQAFDMVDWKLFDAEIKNDQGEVIFSQKDVEFPEFWSQNSVNIAVEKYFYGEFDSPNREKSLKEVVSRVLGKIKEWAIEQKYFGSSKKEKQYLEAFLDELKYMLITQRYFFNSPVWFNLGVPSRKQQVAACFINSIEDTMESIAENVSTEMQIFRFGSGAGSNRSKLRSSKEFLTGGGRPSGPCSFMKVFDTSAAVTKSGGITRRAAKMEILDTDHGDIFEFINQKRLEELKAQALIKAGYNSRFDDPNGAYGAVFFQNSNQSISALDSLMEAYQKKEKYALLARYPAQHWKNEIPKKYLKNDMEWEDKYRGYYSNSQGDFYGDDENSWLITNDGSFKVLLWTTADEILTDTAKNAWATGDPGIQFPGTMNRWNTVPNSGTIRATNPCSEYVFLDDTSCNLGSHNLMRYLNGSIFDIEAFVHANFIVTIAHDIFIEKADYPTEKIAQETKKYHTIGIGYTNLGALLMSLGIPYESEEGYNFGAAVTALMHFSALKASNYLASIVGSFQEWNQNSYAMHDIILQHADALNKIETHKNENIEYILKAAGELAKYLTSSVLAYRNAQVTVLAPTGTIGLVMGSDTTGVEPLIGLGVTKKLAGGGSMTFELAACVSRGLKTLGYTNSQILEINEYVAKNFKLKGAPHLKIEHLPVFHTAIGNETISYMGHLNMMAAIQPFLSGAISKTVNLPNSTTVEEIKEIYLKSYKMGIKAVALYRDGCKMSQPLNVKSDDKKEVIKEVKEVLTNGRPKPIRKKLPDDADALRHKFDIAGHEGYIHAGLYPDDSIGEIFIKMSHQGSTIAGLMDLLGISISIGLQHGVNVKNYINKFKNTKFDPAGITRNSKIRFTSSIGDYIARWLEFQFVDDDEDYIIPEVTVKQPTQEELKELSGPPCLRCGNIMIRSGKCHTCPKCGYSDGCG